MKRFAFVLISLAVVITFVFAPAVALAAPPSGPQDIFIATSYPSIVVTKGDSISFSINLDNKTDTWQSLNLQVQAPQGWQATFKSGGYTVNQVMVEPGKAQSVDLQLTAPDNAASNQPYSFTVRAANADNSVIKELHLSVTLKDKEAKSGLKLDTQYPDLRGSGDNTFSFKLNLTNQSDQDRTVNVDATAPEGWQVSIKPSYESKEVRSFSLKGNGSQSIDVDVTPPRRIEAGDYQVTVNASAGSDQVQVPLAIAIEGKPNVSLTTANGNLNTQASSDTETKVSLVINNSGSAPLQNVSLSAASPDGWDVKFTPDKIDELPVGQTTNVTLSLKPSTRALAGDYLVTLTASSGGASDSKDLRVTVETPTTWGWAAVGAIALIVIGLGVVFVRFSRR
ncbi:MAG TPA: NEW3 domain-containing protein [Anaerolineae bacterium]|nr:NEW3 domain-containing protein [Anaerolineae bacterium]